MYGGLEMEYITPADSRKISDKNESLDLQVLVIRPSEYSHRESDSVTVVGSSNIMNHPKPSSPNSKFQFL